MLAIANNFALDVQRSAAHPDGIFDTAFLAFESDICYTGFPEGMQMQVVVLNGTLSEAEQDVYIQQVTARCPIGLIEKLFLDVQGDYVDVHYPRHCFRQLRKMGGCCIGAPEDWNYAKQSELRDTVPNPIL